MVIEWACPAVEDLEELDHLPRDSGDSEDPERKQQETSGLAPMASSQRREKYSNLVNRQRLELVVWGQVC
jgi:hypothetical protein